MPSHSNVESKASSRGDENGDQVRELCEFIGTKLVDTVTVNIGVLRAA